MQIREEDGRLLAKVVRGPTRLYMIELRIARPVCLAAHAGEDAWRWHARFGHINFAALRKMGKDELVRGLQVLDQVEQVCEACLAGKHRRAPFPSRALRRATRPLELLHGDLCGPITPPTPSGNRYFLLLVDDYSRFMWLALLPTKDGAPAAIKRIQVAAERKSGEKLRALRTDRGGEFTAADFNNYCAELGVRRELTAPYSPQQNGVIKRRNQSVAVTTAVYLLNRSTSKSTGGKTPYELWNGSTPAVHHLRTFGCVAHVKVTTPNLRKLDDRSRPMIFVGYEPGSNAYRAYDPAHRCVRISRDVVFDEQAVWNDFIIEYASVDQPGVEVQTGIPEQATRTPAGSSNVLVQFATPPAAAEEALDANHDGAPLRFRQVDNVLGPASPPGLVARELHEDLFHVDGEEPATFA
ncbi:hypothetical protein U9M48_024782 [Paspalum notatum var. saurae]|uniref:Integrase catalytic domain-containing protein n=1 Tax=Paspalum notatum var. saurae TaxID=547442 RepID=A0AAQ3WXJ0_PASNO